MFFSVVTIGMRQLWFVFRRLDGAGNGHGAAIEGCSYVRLLDALKQVIGVAAGFWNQSVPLLGFTRILLSWRFGYSIFSGLADTSETRWLEFRQRKRWNMSVHRWETEKWWLKVLWNGGQEAREARLDTISQSPEQEETAQRGTHATLGHCPQVQRW